MKHLPIALLVACGVLSLNCTLWAQTIVTYPFDPPTTYYRYTSSLSVGPEGDIWLLIREPLRVARVRDGTLEFWPIYEDDPQSGVPDLAIAPDGTIYIDNFQYEFSIEAGLEETGIAPPVPSSEFGYIKYPGTIDVDGRMFCVVAESNYMASSTDHVFEMYRNAPPEERTSLHSVSMLAISSDEFWFIQEYISSYGSYGPNLLKLSFDSGKLEGYYPIDTENHEVWTIGAMDSNGRLWLSGEDIATFDGTDFTLFADADPVDYEHYSRLCLAANGAIWSSYYMIYRVGYMAYYDYSIVRFENGEADVFSTDDGLLTPATIYPPVIDFDGNVWIGTYGGLSCITDGGWPPMRVTLNKMETPSKVAIKAQVINNGPVVGVDVYIALELNGQLLYWPNWQPEPHANQVNLRPGHNQTATIIQMPRSEIPPGTYTFWGCMTGRNTQKLIGPIDRKLESLVVTIPGD